MSYRAIAVVVLGLCLLLAGSAGSAPPGAKTYQALEKEFEQALGDYEKALSEAKTAQQKQKVMRDKHPRVGDFSRRFMALARKHPDSPVAIDALAWVVSRPLPPNDPQAALRDEALTILARDHPGNNKVGILCTMLVFAIDPGSEKFLRAVLERSKQPEVLARACASLAVNLKHRARLIPALKENADAVKEYEQVFGKKVVGKLLAGDPTRLRGESEKLFERVVEKYGNSPHPTHGTLEKFARRHLLAMRKPADVNGVAPPISGEDIAGKKMRLSDFKGKVVLLDFWGHAFPPCRAMYAYERGLVKRLAGKPFVLLGVNGDPDRAALRRVVKEEKITWRSFWDGDVYGPAATRWDVDVRPSLFLIDHKGIIRYFFAGWPDTKKLDATIDALVRDAARATE